MVNKQETKTEYVYDAEGRVNQIRHYLKDDYQMPCVDMTEQFTYANGKVQSMKRYNKVNDLIETTTYSFYNEGRMRPGVLEGPTKGITLNVYYTSLPGKTGISGKYLTDANYQFSHYPYTTDVTCIFK